MPLVEGTCQKYALGKHIRWDVATVVEEKGFREVSKSEGFRFSLYIPEQELKGNIMKKGEYYSIKHGIKKKWKKSTFHFELIYSRSAPTPHYLYDFAIYDYVRYSVTSNNGTFH